MPPMPVGRKVPAAEESEDEESDDGSSESGSEEDTASTSEESAWVDCACPSALSSTHMIETWLCHCLLLALLSVLLVTPLH